MPLEKVRASPPLYYVSRWVIVFFSGFFHADLYLTLYGCVSIVVFTFIFKLHGVAMPHLLFYTLLSPTEQCFGDLPTCIWVVHIHSV